MGANRFITHNIVTGESVYYDSQNIFSHQHPDCNDRVLIAIQLPTPTNIMIRELTDERFRACPSIYFYFTDFDDVAIVFNSAFNFVLYCLFGKRFRRHLKTILSGRRLRVDPLGATLEVSKVTKDAGENQRSGSTIATISRLIARRET